MGLQLVLSSSMTDRRRQCRKNLAPARFESIEVIEVLHFDAIQAINERLRSAFRTSKQINHGVWLLSWTRMARMTPKTFPACAQVVANRGENCVRRSDQAI